MTKLVVDIKQEIIAIGCELHIDCVDELIQDGSKYSSLWGANIYPDKKIDFVSLINIRPKENNRSMEIQDEKIKEKVKNIIEKLLF
ncbi:hypothetical protein COS59_00965 [Candidatus Wolfebacteria bacterium CG03_land_8_20_14_0_80_36_15]|uniref:Uncharacterized protein n=1 Tax=Candidatus Wolfebacteria bacterium CG03_land_8_20_14_0_80_36_15 TaxID=1975067 RepID=A0A2M7B7W6_9BACT|nr:MAG: hypothetical protein COS59_00965 [Candidatus Wolfebacteria bacterium CG03_land_8_20_14_0_80_36_15]